MKNKVFFIILNVFFLTVYYKIARADVAEVCRIQFYSNNYAKAIKSCENAAKKNYKDGYFYLGRIYLNSNQPRVAINFFKKARQLTANPYSIGKIYRYIGIAYLNLYLHNKFLYYRDNFIDMSGFNNCDTNMYIAMNNLVALHLMHKLFIKMVFYFHKSLKMSSTNYDFRVFNDLAYAYFFDNRINKAISFEKKAIKSAQKSKDLKDLPLYLFNLSYFQYMKNHVNDSAKKQWQESFDNFLARLKKYTSKFPELNTDTQISKIISNIIKVN
jgi:tetratricopeptide (TPR) repeat protein